MTLKDLVSTNHRICEIDADIRDYSNGKALLIDSFNIGIRAFGDRVFDENHEPRWKAITKPINYKDIGKDYWGVIEKNIPKQLLDMEVRDWDLWHGWSTDNGWIEYGSSGIDFKYTDEYRTTHRSYLSHMGWPMVEREICRLIEEGRYV